MRVRGDRIPVVPVKKRGLNGQVPIGSYEPRKGWSMRWCDFCSGTGRTQYATLFRPVGSPCSICEGKGRRWVPKLKPMKFERHSPKCFTDEMRALHHEADLLRHIAHLALKFIEDSPPGIKFTRAGKAEEPNEIRLCKYCGGAQVQFGKPFHADHCIVREIRAAYRKMREHTEALHFGRTQYNFRGREAIDLRLAMRWLETGKAATKPRSPKPPTRGTAPFVPPEYIAP